MGQVTSGLLKITSGIGRVKVGAVGVGTGTDFTDAVQISTGITKVTVSCAGVNSVMDRVTTSHVQVRHDMSSVGPGHFGVTVVRGVRPGELDILQGRWAAWMAADMPRSCSCGCRDWLAGADCSQLKLCLACRISSAPYRGLLWTF